MKVLLTGASGFLGSNISCALTSAGHQVIPISRRHGIDFCSMQNPADWLPHLEDVDAVVNSVGIIGEQGTQHFDVLHTKAPVSLFNACTQAGVRRVIQISALGADKSAFSAYHLSKLVADDCLRDLDLEWFVLRPSLIYGKGGKSSELFMRLAALPIIPVLGDGLYTVQPVHITDVVATVLQCLTSEATKQTLDIVGSETITFAEWLQRMRQAQGFSRTKQLHIPFAIARCAARLGKYFSPMLQPQNLSMLQQGYSSDVTPLVRFLERLPLPIESHLFFTDCILERRAA